MKGHQAKGVLVAGSEVGFARTLHAAGWRDMAIIKVHANFRRDVMARPWGGGPRFNPWAKFIDARLAELKAQGYSIPVDGFLWHQGIDDATLG